MWPVIVSLLFMILSVPLILQKVPPNPLYGFRTPKTMSDERIWYEANRVAGWDLLFAGLFILAAVSVMDRVHPGVVLATVGVAVAHSFWVLRRL